MFWLIWVTILGLIAGWATGKIMKGSGYGALMDIVREAIHAAGGTQQPGTHRRTYPLAA